MHRTTNIVKCGNGTTSGMTNFCYRRTNNYYYKYIAAATTNSNDRLTRCCCRRGVSTRCCNYSYLQRTSQEKQQQQQGLAILMSNQSLHRIQLLYCRHSSTTTPITTTLTDATTASAKNTIANVKNESYEKFQKLLLSSSKNDNYYNDFREAYQLLVSVTATNQPHTSDDNDKNNDNENWKEVAYVQLFDAIMVHHRTLLDAYNYSFPFPTGSSVGTASSSSSSTMDTESTSITMEQLEILQKMISMVEMANNIIELIYPYLGAKYALLENTYFDSSTAISSETVDNIQQDDDDDDSDEYGEFTVSVDDVNAVASSLEHSIDNADGPNIEDTGVGADMTPLVRKQKKRRKTIDDDLTNRCNDVLKAWALTIRAGYKGKVARSFIRAIPQRAQFLLSRMESTVMYMDDITYTGRIIPPSLLSYNSVLETWAYSKEHLRAASAQQIFDKLVSKKVATPYSHIQPDGDSFKHIIWAWALSRERRAAYVATGHLKKMLRQLEVNVDSVDAAALYDGVPIEPTTDEYNIIAKAWIRSEEKDSPSKAQSMLKLIEKMYKAGVTMVQPSLLCYKSVLLAAAQRPTLPDLGPLVDETLTLMKDRFIIPDAECYTAAIKTWKNAAVYQPDVTPTNQQSSVRRTIELLAEMDVAHNQSVTTSIKVSTENINDVLEALTVSVHHTRTAMADDLLNKLSKVDTTTDSLGSSSSQSILQATASSFIYALRVWSTVESIEKIAKGKTILWIVKDCYSDLVQQHYNSTSRRKDKIVDIFNEFVQLCGSYRPKSDRDGLQAFGEALDSIRVMRSMDISLNRGDSSYRYHHKLVPNSSTYASLLIAASKLLAPGGIERRIAVEKIFIMCCDDGMLDDKVLLCFRDIATVDQFATLIEAKSEIVEGMKVVPEIWTVNALGGKVKSADGRKTILLGIDGLLKRTTGMKDFHMRRLLDHRNRDLLRGGRWRDPKQKINSCTQTILSSWKLYDSKMLTEANPES